MSVIPIHLPPLRERRQDIPLLIRHFCAKHGSEQVMFDKDTLSAMTAYSWPGNVRELENSVERLLIMRSGDTITAGELPDKILTAKSGQPKGLAIFRLPDEGYSLEQLEKEIVLDALERNNWNQAAAARFLRIPRHTLIYRLEKFGITLPDRKA